MRTLIAMLAGVGVLAGCGGGSGARQCSAEEEKAFVLQTTRDWYLFPETLPDAIDPDAFADAASLLNELTRTAREQGRDRFFSYVTTRADDEANFAGELTRFGFQYRLREQRLFLEQVLQPGPAAQAGLRRGDEIVAVDALDGRGYRSIAELLAEDPSLNAAFGPNTGDVTRSLRVVQNGDTRELTLVKATFTVDPVPDGEGVRILPLAGTAGVGYLNLLDFSSPAPDELRAAFASFRQAGVSDLIIDLRYNTGGLLSVAYDFADLLGAGLRDELFIAMQFNPQRADNNTEHRFVPGDRSVMPARIAFITTGSTASASETMINGLLPYVQVAIIGTDTFGKPVGQAGFDQRGCDLRLRLETFRLVNADGQTDYFDGLAAQLDNACAADDDIDHAQGDPLEASTAAALDWLASGRCEPIVTEARSKLAASMGLIDGRHPQLR
jgi:carboxyl-terminal processing protease